MGRESVEDDVKVFAVVHINDRSTPVDQAHIALELAADGVFLISHGGGAGEVMGVLGQLRSTHNDAFIGVNLLGHSSLGAMRRVHENLLRTECFTDAVWSDDIRNDDGSPSAAMRYKVEYPELSGVKLFGGVAFKYTVTYTDDPDTAAGEAADLEPFVDVVTTSGPGTGVAAPPRKIAAMKQVIDKPLAIASGVDAANIGDYAGIVDCVLVASSVETEPYSGIFHTARLSEFISVAHSVG